MLECLSRIIKVIPHILAPSNSACIHKLNLRSTVELKRRLSKCPWSQQVQTEIETESLVSDGKFLAVAPRGTPKKTASCEVRFRLRIQPVDATDW